MAVKRLLRSDEWTVGDIVYQSFTPQKPGKVIKIETVTNSEGYPYARLTVKWLDGTTTVESWYHVKRLVDLIADHEQKVRTHKATLKKAEAIADAE